jgi:hypothetical protein
MYRVVEIGLYIPDARPSWRIEKIKRDYWVAYSTKDKSKSFVTRTLADALNALGRK